ncbi:MAG: methylase [Gammaproteobacteria bacterium HGW-Gammaproteobacteria-15]|nr:MAG: methylase [Gammaproteobacteria bacterium HGW-Gammaproteobacteria-15]
MQSDLPFSQACENNKAPILAVLQQAFANCSKVLEVGSGTGQHAVHFAAALPHLCWQASDQAMYLPDLTERLRRAALPNLPLPLQLDISVDALPAQQFDALFSANTLHIMPWPVVELFFSRLAGLTTQQATLCIYGPFNYNGSFNSDSNRAFALSLKSRDPAMGIRDIAAVVALADAAGFTLQHDHSMPANNRLLQFLRTSG